VSRNVLASSRRLLACLLVLAGAGLALSACGGDAGTAASAPGTDANPLVGNIQAEDKAKARVNEAAAAPTAAPGYQGLLEKQTKQPKSGFTPCNLVTPGQAQAILGGPIRAPLEAPQGPTCIYRTRTGAGYATLSVQSLDLAAIRKNLRDARTISVAGRRAYCGVLGQPMLYAGLRDGRVLAVAARCRVARQFASRAVPRLG
jgi:Protein of unknown function (DUF3558)